MISAGAAIFCFFIAPMIVSGVIAAGSMIHSTVLYEEQKKTQEEQFNKSMEMAEADRQFAREQAELAQKQYNDQIAMLEKQQEENNLLIAKQFAENEIDPRGLNKTQAGRNIVNADIANRSLRNSLIYSYGKTNRREITNGKGRR